MTEEERAYLVCRDPSLLHQLDSSGRSLLHLAAQAGRAAVCRIYMRAGLDPACRDDSGRSAADLARAAGYMSLSRTLEGSVAVYTGQITPLKKLEKSAPLDPHEQRGLIAGEESVVANIIGLGRLSVTNTKGDTPLHLAAAGGHVAICSRLFEAGADAVVKNNAWQTPAEMAAEAGHIQLAVLLRGLTAEPSPVIPTAIGTLGVGVHEATSGTLELGFLDHFDFVGEEDASLFHSRQEIENVSATFRPLSVVADIRGGSGEDAHEWALPDALTRVRDANLQSDQDPGISGRKGGPEFDFSYSTRRSTRKARKLQNTTFRISSEDCRQWVAEALERGCADELAIGELVSLCQGNHISEDLAANIRKTLQSAGLPLIDELLPFEMLVREISEPVDAEQLCEALIATCNRNTVIPGRRAFEVDRTLEDRLIREIGNARHELFNGLLDDAHVRSAILADGARIVAGEMSSDTFTDLDLGAADDEAELLEFAEQLEALRSAVSTGSEITGRARRAAIEALDLLEISRLYLLSLETGHTKVSVPISELLSKWDRSTEQLLLAHMPFARRETAKMAWPDEDPEDLFQESYFAMRRAVERFDPERGVRFYMYAQFWIRQQLTRWRINNRSLIRVPVHRFELHEKMASFVDEFRQENFRNPSDREMAEAMECDAKTVRSLKLALSPPLEFNAVFANTPDGARSPEHSALAKNQATVFSRAFNNLREREEAVLRLRFGVWRDEDMTLEEVGQLYSVTRERIRQIEAGALKRLKHPANSRILRTLL